MVHVRGSGWVRRGSVQNNSDFCLGLDGRCRWYVHYNMEVWKKIRYEGEVGVRELGGHACNSWSRSEKKICCGDRNLVFIGLNVLFWRECEAEKSKSKSKRSM